MGPERRCPHDGDTLSEITVDDPRAGEVLAGRYRLERRLDEGGMGVVYLAVQTSVGREVAVKLLHRERRRDQAALARFMREAHAVSRLESPHVVTLIDFGEAEGGELFLVMERLRGRTLQDALDGDAPLDPLACARVLDQIASALAEAHEQGIVHRDLKPANIFLVDAPGYTDFAKVLDFGVAALATGEGGPAGHLTESGAVPGTPRYLAPEAQSGGVVRPTADIWALGVIAYELLNGRRPFDGESVHDLRRAHALDDPAPWERRFDGEPAPAALRRLVERCLAKSPGLRPRDGQAFRDALREALAASDLQLTDPGASASRVTPRPRPATGAPVPTLSAPGLAPRGRSRRGLIVAIAAYGALAAVVAVLAWPSAPTPTSASAPVVQPDPVAASEPVSAPAPAPESVSVPAPEPDSVPGPVSKPEAVSASAAPAPVPVSAPAPAPEPAPVAAPAPAPETTAAAPVAAAAPSAVAVRARPPAPAPVAPPAPTLDAPSPAPPALDPAAAAKLKKLLD